MEDKLPDLRVVSAEIETSGQSPRGDLASPSSGVVHSGDSFGKALMHQAKRLKNVMMNQRVRYSPHRSFLLIPCCSDNGVQHQLAGSTRLTLTTCRGDDFANGGQVNFMDVAKHPRLAKAARAELDGHGSSASGGLGSPSFEVRPHDAEVRAHP